MPEEKNYGNAAQAYKTTAITSSDQRSLESHVLLKADQNLENLARAIDNKEDVSLEEIGDVLDYNCKLWQLFVSDAKSPDHPLPQEIKNNIVSLGLYVFKRTHEILADTTPEKFKVLININRSIASGLMKSAAQPQTPASPAPPTSKAAILQETDHLI